MDVILPADIAQMVKEKVASGEYESESEVILEGLRALQARESQIEYWLRTEVAAAYDEYKTDPSRAAPAEEVFARIRARRETAGSPARE